MKLLQIRTHNPQEFVDVTAQVAKVVEELKVKEGVCFVFVPHTTAGVTVNENADPDVRADILMELGKMVPQVDNYRHSEGNSAAHIKASLMGSGATVPVSGGKLALGTWQGIYFCEFDGPRQRSMHIQVIGDGK